MVWTVTSTDAEHPSVGHCVGPRCRAESNNGPMGLSAGKQPGRLDL